MTTKKRILLISHNTFGYRALKALIEYKFTVCGVIYRSETTKVISDYTNAFGHLCETHGIPARDVDNVNDPASIRFIRECAPDVICVFGWSQILKDELFDLAPLGLFGTHPSLLPKNRGNAAIPWQIINNEKESGLSLFKFEKGKPVDSGDIYAQERFDITQDETAETFYEKACRAIQFIIETELENILEGKKKGKKQDESKATYLPRRRPKDGQINWTWEKEYIERFVRAVGTPYPGAFTYYKGAMVKILKGSMGAAHTPHPCGTIISSSQSGVEVACKNGSYHIEAIANEHDEPKNLTLLVQSSKFDEFKKEE